jgi:hypothetical protein
VRSNPALTDVDGLSGLRSVDRGLSVVDNLSLSSCSCGLYGLLSAGSVGGGVEIYANAAGCDSADEITEPVEGACKFPVSGEQDVSSGLALIAAPNPAGAAVSLQFALAEPARIRLAVYDVLGRLVAVVSDGATGTGERAFELGNLASGTYIARLEVGTGRVEVVRFTVAR